MSKERADVLLVEKGKVESRSLAQRLIMAGEVFVNGQKLLKPSQKIDTSLTLEIRQKQRFVSRGGEKLAAAMDVFPLNYKDKICADLGASTGGFTDCMLQAGAQKVFAIDVGKGILHWKLRQDQRVIVMESTNARYLESLPEPVQHVTIDASFISLKLLLPVVKKWFQDTSDAQVMALIKPQFEAGKKEVSRGKGVVRDPFVHRKVLFDILDFIHQEGYQVRGLAPSPVLGPKGNREFLAWLGYPQQSKVDTNLLVDQIIPPIDEKIIE